MTQQRTRGLRTVATMVALGLATLGAMGTLATGAGAQSAGSAPGVDDRSVKVGFISSETGLAAPNFVGAADGCKARVGAENAKGGVNGRKIEVEAVDDKSADNLGAAKDLVESRDVFTVVNDSALAFLSWHYLKDAGVPIIGGGFDGSYYYDQGNESIISALGDSTPIPGITTDVPVKAMKKLGAKKIAAVGYSISPSSSETAKATVNYAAKELGLEKGYLNSTLDYGSTDVGPIVLGIKNSGSDGVLLPLDSNTNFAIVQQLQQNGADIKANVLSTGYSQDLLDQPVAETMTPHDLLQTGYKPIELGGSAVKTFTTNLKKYGGITGVPNYGVYSGYVTCDLAILGLKTAGKNPTRQGFVDGIRTANGGIYDSAGLFCRPLDLSYAHFGKISTSNCLYFVQVKNGKFVPYNKGKALTGTMVGDPDILAKYTQDSATSTTTSAASPPGN